MRVLLMLVQHLGQDLSFRRPSIRGHRRRDDPAPVVHHLVIFIFQRRLTVLTRQRRLRIGRTDKRSGSGSTGGLFQCLVHLLPLNT